MEPLFNTVRFFNQSNACIFQEMMGLIPDIGDVIEIENIEYKITNKRWQVVKNTTIRGSEIIISFKVDRLYETTKEDE